MVSHFRADTSWATALACLLTTVQCFECIRTAIHGKHNTGICARSSQPLALLCLWNSVGIVIQLLGLHSLYYYVGYHSLKVVINLVALCTLLWAPSWEATAYKALCM
jgi:hypothetical protein